MRDFDLRRITDALDDGDEVAARDVRTLVEELELLRRSAVVPSEFMVRVARSGRTPTKWTASHPLLPGSREAKDPADALMMAAGDLRRELARLGWHAPDDGVLAPFRSRAKRFTRDEADVLARTDESPTGTALVWALSEVDRLDDELSTAQGHNARAWMAGTSCEARAEIREERVAELRNAGVSGVNAEYGVDGFGDADQVGLDLPALVIAWEVDDGSRFDGVSFTPDREWYAVAHRVVPRPMSRYLTAVVTPLAVSESVELALRIVGDAAPEGETIADHRRYGDLVSRELPGVSVDRISGLVSPGACPFELDSLDVLCAEHLDLADLASSTGIWSFPRWNLYWLTDRAEHGGF